MADPDLAALQSDPELATIFLSEAFDHLSSVEANVLTLEFTPDRPLSDYTSRLVVDLATGALTEERASPA